MSLYTKPEIQKDLPKITKVKLICLFFTKTAENVFKIYFKVIENVTTNTEYLFYFPVSSESKHNYIVKG